MKVSLFVFVAVFFFSLHCDGQNNFSSDLQNKVLGPPPNAAALGKFGDVPVTPYNGTVNINVPLIDIQVRDLKIPVSLSYHTGGFRANEEAGWIGLGWALNASGVIMRTVRDKDDFLYNYVRNHHLIYCQTQACKDENEDWFNQLASANTQKMLGVDNVDALKPPPYDWQPDLFTFNFNGYSGSFIFDQDNNIRFVGDQQNISVSFANYIFTLATPDGFRYTFSPSSPPSDCYDVAHSLYSVGPRTWLLTKIISAMGEEATFEYENKQTTKTTKRTYISTGQATMSPQILDPYRPGSFEELANLCYNSVTENYFGCTESESLLSKIIYNGGTVEFKGAMPRQDLANSHRLDSIIHTTSSQKRKFALTYGYFTAQNAGVTNYWLRLDALQEIGRNPYVFEYSAAPLVPKYAYYTGDNWGFNNVISVENLGDSTTLRELDETAMLAGMITKLTYPSGGYTAFEFEPHTFYEDSINYANPDANVILKGYSYDSASTHIHTEPVLFMEGKRINPYTNYGRTRGRLIVEWYLRPLRGFDNMDQMKNFWVDLAGDTINVLKASARGKKVVDVARNSYPLQTHIPSGFMGEAWIKVRYHRFNYGGGVRIKSVKDYDGQSVNPVKVVTYTYGDRAVNSVGKNVETKPYGKEMSSLVFQYRKVYDQEGGCLCVKDEMYKESAVPLGNSASGSHVGYDSVAVKTVGLSDNGKTVFQFINRFDVALSLVDPSLPTIPNESNGKILKETFYNASGKPVKQTLNFYSQVNAMGNFGFVFYENPFSAIKHRDAILDMQDVGTAPPPSPACWNRFFYYQYPIVSHWNRLDKTVQRTFDQQTGKYKESVSQFSYRNTTHKLPNIMRAVNEAGDSVLTYSMYPADFSDSGGFIGDLKNNFVHNVPVEEVEVKKNSSNVTTIISGRVTTYKAKGLIDENYVLETNAPIAQGNFKFSNASLGSIAFGQAPMNFAPDAAYKSDAKYAYDQNNNIIEANRKNDYKTSYLWDYTNTLPIAQVKNAGQADIAYTSFESNGNGRWTFDPAAIISTQWFSGAKSYSLSASLTISIAALNPSQTYVLSFWAKSGVPFVSDGPATAGQMKNGWTYFEKTFTGRASVSLSGASIVDEIRLRPQNSQMTTYVYAQGIGLTTALDANHVATYYEYDVLGRLQCIKDDAGNIVKKFDYAYKLR